MPDQILQLLYKSCIAFNINLRYRAFLPQTISTDSDNKSYLYSFYIKREFLERTCINWFLIND